MSKKLTFARKLADARPFEKDAFNAIAPLIGVGSWYPLSELVHARVEAEMTRPGIKPSEGTVDIFFRLVNSAGGQEIAFVLQPIEGYYAAGGLIYSDADPTAVANATIEDEISDGHFVISSMIDGKKVSYAFDPSYGFYLPRDAATRSAVLNRLGTKLAKTAKAA